MKIFKKNLNNNSKRITLRKTETGKMKYLPSFSKEWKNIIYCYNQNNFKNIPVNNININKIIKSYFNLYFKNHKFVGSRKFILLKRRRNFIRRIYVSNAEIKHTNNKAIITLYTVNRESLLLKKKYLKINKKISKKLIKRFLLLYRKKSKKWSKIRRNVVNNKMYVKMHKKNKYLYRSYRQTQKKIFLNYKFKHLKKFLEFHTIYLKKIWSVIVSKYCNRHLKLLRKYDLMYSLNKYKFNKQIFLPILSKILNKIIRKKIQYNIINLKSITYNTDLFTNALALKLKRRSSTSFAVKNMFRILNRAYLPDTAKTQIYNSILKKAESIHSTQCEARDETARKRNLFFNVPHAPHKYNDLNLTSMLRKLRAQRILGMVGMVRRNKTASVLSSAQKQKIKTFLLVRSTKNNFDRLLGGCSNIQKVHSTIYNSIAYKNMSGIRLEIKGRLTKHYRADRSIYSLKWKGGLKNKDSSLNGLSSVLFRGNSPSNVSYSIYNSKRRIGAFAVKGWISGG